jgi:hypothetical protein
MAYLAIPAVRRTQCNRERGGHDLGVVHWFDSAFGGLDGPVADGRVVPRLAIPLAEAIPVRSSLPAVIVAYPAWSVPSQGWRAEKPLKPWFRSMAPYAVVAAFGATSIDLTALGLGVPELTSPHLFESQTAFQEHAAGFGLGADLSALFGTPHDAAFGLSASAWDQPDFITPAGQRPPEPSHDWWA